MARGKSLATHLAKVRQDHAMVEVIFARKGLSTIDPESAAGREVLELVDTLMHACSPKRSAAVALQGVQIFIEAVLLRRSLFTQICALGGVVPTGFTKKAAAERSAWKACMEAYNRMTPQMERACRLMGVEGFAEFAVNSSDDIGELTAHLKRLRELAEQEQQREITATAREITDADTLPATATAAESDAAAADGAPSGPELLHPEPLPPATLGR